MIRPRFFVALAAALLLWMACGGDDVVAPPAPPVEPPPIADTLPPEPIDTATPPDTLPPPEPIDSPPPPVIIPPVPQDSVVSIWIWPDSVAVVDSIVVYPPRYVGERSVQFCLFANWSNGENGPVTNSLGVPVCDSILAANPRWR